MSIKVSTGLKDAWGQEIFLGDLVVDTINCSWAKDKPDVVTRIGSAGNFQKNGSSYSKPENHVVVTAQYVAFKGQAAHEKLLDRYPIQLEAVKKKNPPVLCVVATQSWLQTGRARKFYVFRWEDSEAGRKELFNIQKDVGCDSSLSFLSESKSYDAQKNSHRFYSRAKGMSTKKLMELGEHLGIDFSMWYNMEITGPRAISVLSKFV
jgi:hypothetical protein